MMGCVSLDEVIDCVVEFIDGRGAMWMPAKCASSGARFWRGKGNRLRCQQSVGKTSAARRTAKGERL